MDSNVFPSKNVTCKTLLPLAYSRGGPAAVDPAIVRHRNNLLPLLASGRLNNFLSKRIQALPASASTMRSLALTLHLVFVCLLGSTVLRAEDVSTNLKPTDIANMKKIGAAIDAYKKVKGDYPPHLS